MRSAVPRTRAILTSWSTLSVPLKNGSLRRIYLSSPRGAYNSCEDAAQAPDVQRIVVILHPRQYLRRLIIARGDPRMVFLAGEVELGQAPVDYLQLPGAIVHNQILGLDIPVHNSLAVDAVEVLFGIVRSSRCLLSVFCACNI